MWDNPDDIIGIAWPDRVEVDILYTVAKKPWAYTAVHLRKGFYEGL